MKRAFLTDNKALVFGLSLLVLANAMESTAAEMAQAAASACYRMDPVTTAVAEPFRRAGALTGAAAYSGLAMVTLSMEAVNNLVLQRPPIKGHPTKVALDLVEDFNAQLTAPYGCFFSI